MRKVAFIGSREGVPAQEVSLKLNALYNEHGQFIVVSGGGPNGSVNFVAEQTAIEFGLPVISFRPKRTRDYGVDEQYIVQEWRLHKGSGTVIEHGPEWKDWQSAANFRSMLIVERANEAYAFQFNKSRGTAFEIELFEAAKKPVYVAEFGLAKAA